MDVSPQPNRAGRSIGPRPSLARRLLRGLLRLLIPAAITAVAALLGYAYAIYPIWYHIDQVRRTETLGGFMPAGRQDAVRAYDEDNHFTADSLDRVVWAVRTVMTPFVGYGAAPGQWYNAYIDKYQFRGHRELVMPKPAGVTRVFLTGASVAFSAGAPSDDRTIGGYLQRLLDERSASSGERYEVFTFATPAWSSTHERIGVENRLSELQPDLVISLTGAADALYGERGLNVLWARAVSDQYYWDLVNLALQRSGFAPMTDVQDVSPGPVPPELVAARLRKNAVLAAGALALAGARYHVFLQPAIVTTGKALSGREKLLRFGKIGYFKDPDYYKRSYAEIDRALKDSLPANAAFTNLSGVVDAVPADQDVFLDSYHFADRGNELIAKAMVAALPATLAAPGPAAGTAP
jgi:hypothetical protein